MDNGFVTCPFNPAHRMLKLRLQYHIVKCRKNYLTAGMKPCPYNATHIVAEDTYRDHILSCPDSVLIEGHKYNDGNQIHGKLNQGAFHFDIDQDKSWESPDSEEGSSEVSEPIENKDCFQYLDLLNEFEEEEEPLQRVMHEERKSEASSSSSSSSREGNIPGKQKIQGEEEVASQVKELKRMAAGRGKLISLLMSLDK